MKNMILPAKNSKKLSLLGFLCALLLLAAACKPNQPLDPQQNLHGDVPRPTWTAQDDYDYSSSMTAVIRIDSLQASAEDIVAAFVGEECRGIATYDAGLFYLYIAGPGETFTLRFWSAYYTNLFASEPIPFVNDTQLGSYAEPYKPQWVLLTQ